MKPIEIIAQIISIFAMAMNILSYQQKRKQMAIGFQFFGSLLFSVSFFMLGATVGGILNLVGVVRAVVYMNRERFRSDHIAWLYGFTAVYIASYILTFTVFGKEPTAQNFVIEFLPVIGMIATTVGFRMKGAAAVRRLGLISSPSWLIYNIASFSLGAILCEVFSLVSIFIGMIRHDRKK